MPIAPGDTASPDHKVPLSRGGSSSLENIQWVNYQVNRMKNDMTHDEFLAMCQLVLDHADWKRNR
jgi:5-methylcytosine-specific restriction endonuclease McrA